MIVFAALTPHAPALIPHLAGESYKKIKKTIGAMTDLEKRLYSTHPEVILVLSPHGKVLLGTMSIYVDQDHECTLREIGDYSTKFSCAADTALAEQIRHYALDQGLNLKLKTVKDLDYGAVVPLFYLAKHLKKPKLLVMNSHLEGLKENYHAGKLLKETLTATKKRVAIIASTDLAHQALSYSEERARDFDSHLVKLIENNNLTGLLSLDNEQLALAKPCGLHVLLLLLGLLDGLSYTAQNFSYEAPLGVGYLVTNFKLS